MSVKKYVIKIFSSVVIVSVITAFSANYVNALSAMNAGVGTQPNKPSQSNETNPVVTTTPGAASGDTTHTDTESKNRTPVQSGNISGAAGTQQQDQEQAQNIVNAYQNKNRTQNNAGVMKPPSAERESTTIDEWMQEAQDFIKDGEKNSGPKENQLIVDKNQLKETSNILYNMLLAAGIIVAILVGMFLGMKYMIGSVEEKADLKQTLMAYAVGCIVIFGAFGIWKLVVEILSEI